MAQIPDSTTKKHRSGCFLGCFGFSQSPRKVKENPTKKLNKSSGKLSWFSWSKKSPKKTAPVTDAAATENLLKEKESFRVAKLSRKFSAGDQLPRKIPVDSSVPAGDQIPADTGGDEAVHGRPDKTTADEKGKKQINLENGKSLNHSNSTTKEVVTHKKGIIFRRNSWSQPPSTLPADDKSPKASRRATSTYTLSHSVSMPPASTSKHPADRGGADQYSQRKNDTGSAKFDQLVGMSIIVVTLLIMIIWGKLCAILCTSAWLYFYPNILKATKSSDRPTQMITGNSTKSLDLDESKNLKKKVVFEGFLERTAHRTN